MRFGGSGIPSFNKGEQLTVKVYTTSQMADTDYVAFHWARNTFGFHRVPFVLESQPVRDHMKEFLQRLFQFIKII